jgi:hypothetical protein
MADEPPVDPAIWFTDYALTRMRDHDILREEAESALRAPRSRHKHRKDGRSEVRQRFGRRTLLVVYKRSLEELLVINAMWE